MLNKCICLVCYNLVRLQIACCHLVFGKKSPSFQNVDIFPELDRCTPCVFIGTVAHFSRNKSLLISFGAPVIQPSMPFKAALYGMHLA